MDKENTVNNYFEFLAGVVCDVSKTAYAPSYNRVPVDH